MKRLLCRTKSICSVSGVVHKAQDVINWNYALKRWTSQTHRICSAKIVPHPHIGCREHSLSFMTNPITSFNIPPAHDPTSLWGPLQGQVLLIIVLSYEIHFLLNAEAATWFFFSLCYCCCFVISLWGGMPDHKVHDCQPFSDLCTTTDLSSSSKRTKLQQK